MDQYIGRERKVSNFPGGGIQYIPGHDEPFIDYFISEYVAKQSFSIALELGGGGFRFALPASQYLQKIIVVDIDKESLDINKIIIKLKSLGNFSDTYVSSKIETEESDIFLYLSKTSTKFDLVVISRLIHFLDKDQMKHLIKLLEKVIKKDGLVCVSALTLKEKNSDTYNEFYLNSHEVDSIYYRKMNADEKTQNLLEKQNLPQKIHLFEKEYIQKIFSENFILIDGPYWATRTVQGFIFKKT